MPKVDVITLSVVRNYLISTAIEMREEILRTSFHPVIYEDRDFACGLLDTDAGTLAEAPGLTFFMGTLSPAVKKCVDEAIGVENLEPEDVIISATPAFTGSHPPDALVFSPIFYEGKLFGYAASKGHMLDLGAKDPYPTDSTNIFEEGLQLPPVKLYKKGELQPEIREIIKWNSRAPDIVWGDIHAEIASHRVAKNRITKLLDKYGFEVVSSCIEQIYDHSEKLTRSALEEMPDGTWSGEDYMDDNGVERGKPVKIMVTITIKGNSITVDFTGSDKEQKGSTNCPIISTISASRMIAKILTTPELPANEGCFRPLKVIAPPGSVFNPGPMVPTFLYGWPALAAIEVMLKVLAPVFPEKIPTCSGGDLCGVLRYGYHPKTGKFWMEAPIEVIGMGASRLSDGESAMVHIAEACSRNLPVEVEETLDPLLIERYELIQDSGGPGERRGGLGVRRDIRFLAPGALISVIERGRFPHWGANGGMPGARNYVLVKTANSEVEKYAIAKTAEGYEVLKCPSVELAKGDLVSIRTGGGGGYGDPLNRDPEAVRQDVINAYVSVESAERDYGVVIDPHTLEIDIKATERLRKQMREKRARK